MRTPDAPPFFRICLSAYGCTPGKGSEDGVGWGWTKALSAHADITLITRNNNVPAIRNELDACNIASVKVVGVDWPVWLRFWKRGSRGAMAYHYIWQFLALLTARKLHKETPFDLFHHLNFSVSWQPCWLALAGRCIFGPIDGMGIIPSRFWPTIGLKNTLAEIVRRAAVWFGEHADPFVSWTRRHVAAFVFRTQFVSSRCLRTPNPNRHTIPDTGLDISEIRQLTELSQHRGKSNVIKVVFMGRLVARKGVVLALKSFALAAKDFGNLNLVMIGDGPERKALTQLGEKLGISSQLQFTGKLDRHTAWETMAGSDIFLYPSLRDAVATVILEAMSAGLPIICLGGTGPAQVMRPDIGITVQPEDERGTVANLAAALVQLIEDEKLRQDMGQRAQESALREHTWDARASAIMKVYSSLLQDEMK